MKLFLLNCGFLPKTKHTRLSLFLSGFSVPPNTQIKLGIFFPVLFYTFTYYREFIFFSTSLWGLNSKGKKANHRVEDMAEEHRCQAPRLCVNNCGFFGSPATQNLCSKCFRDLQLKEQQSSSAKIALNQSLHPSSSMVQPASSKVPPPPEVVYVASSSQPLSDLPAAIKEEKPVPVVTSQPGRCMTCRKRVGLTGFKCRCGLSFCGSHRYPENHNCEFDFKGIGREQIAKANPLVKADKLEKI